MKGTLAKMQAKLTDNNDVDYQLPIGEQQLRLNDLIGKSITFIYTGNIYCCHCGNKTKKSYSQGHCYVCMKKLASCDLCIMKPETCHYANGTCRQPEWGEKNCFVPHYVYLSNTSGIKVGITRYTQIPTRWIDQGATQGLPILKVSSRQISGLIEIELAKFIKDKTNWRTMLKGNQQDIDLTNVADILLPKIQDTIDKLKTEFGDDSIEFLSKKTQMLNFPINVFPNKINSYNLDKSPIFSDTLKGIKGQYLIFEHGVINIRKFTAYEVNINIEE